MGTTTKVRVYHHKGGRRKEIPLKKCKRSTCDKLIKRQRFTRGRKSTTMYEKQDYCSHDCFSKDRRVNHPVENRICKYFKCKKTLVRKYYKDKIESISLFNQREYCDIYCYHRDRRSIQKEKFWVRCWHCTNKLVRGKNEGLFDWRIKKFCDVECYRLYQQDHEGHLKKQMIRGKFPCIFCNVDKPKVELMQEYFK